MTHAACSIDNVSRLAEPGRVGVREHLVDKGRMADVFVDGKPFGHRFRQIAEPCHEPIIARLVRKIAHESAPCPAAVPGEQ
jgi:hypothetical protein